jgi:hypothetical protein
VGDDFKDNETQQQQKTIFLKKLGIKLYKDYKVSGMI